MSGSTKQKQDDAMFGGTEAVTSTGDVSIGFLPSESLAGPQTGHTTGKAQRGGRTQLQPLPARYFKATSWEVSLNRQHGLTPSIKDCCTDVFPIDVPSGMNPGRKKTHRYCNASDC